MITSTPINENVRKAIVHLVVLLIILKYIFIPYILNSDFPANQWNIYSSSILSISFYIHTFLLLPILLIKKKSIKYLTLTLLGFFLVVFSFSWIEAIRSSEIMGYYTNSKPEPFHVFNDLLMGRIILFMGLAFTPFLLISSAYYTLSVDKSTRKGILSSKYAELVVNVIVFASIIFLFFIENGSSNFIPVLGLFALVFYTNTFFITPIFFKNIRKYFTLTALFLILTFQTCQWASSANHFSNTNAIALMILIIFILSFSYGYIRIKLIAKDQLFNLKLGAKEAELNLLKSQVNPHFLFNTLNNLYATSLEENASKTSQSIAKLASLIRYMQEDINKDFIPLLNEVNYIQDYITIQRYDVLSSLKLKLNLKILKDILLVQDY